MSKLSKLAEKSRNWRNYPHSEGK